MHGNSGLGAAHKVANAVFHLRALQCLAARCHPCVKSASSAVILEDDVQFVVGESPGNFPAESSHAPMTVQLPRSSSPRQTVPLPLRPTFATTQRAHRHAGVPFPALVYINLHPGR